MSKETKLIPQLRFPEFEKDGEWSKSSINELCDILNNIRKPVTSTDRTLGEYPYYGASGIIDYIDQYLFDERLLLIGEDVAKWGAFDNTAFLVEGKYWVNNHAHVLKPVGINEKLLESYLVKLNLNPYITGAAPPKLTLRKLKEIPIPVPSSPKEQQKIAACLSSLDELLAAHNDKLAALKDHKKGLLQNLFPRDGETVPRVRFPEFEGDGDDALSPSKGWVEKELSEVSTIITGSTPSTNVSEFYDGEIMFVSPADISINKYVDITDKTLTRAGFEKTRKVKSNSVMFVCIGSTIGKVAMNKYDCATNQQINSCIPNNENSSDFLYSNLELNAFKIAGIAGNQAVPIINKTLFSSVKLKFPPTKEEQQKIAACLSAVDELITAQQEKIEQLKEHKKGLMQGLFPNVQS